MPAAFDPKQKEYPARFSTCWVFLWVLLLPAIIPRDETRDGCSLNTLISLHVIKASFYNPRETGRSD